MSIKSPEKPWKTGRHPQYTALQLVLNLCQDEYGNVWSDHTFASSRDEQVADTLPQGGVPQIAHALLTEAVRREVYQVALIQMSRDPEYLGRWKENPGELRDYIEKHLAEVVQAVITSSVEKMAPGAVSGVLSMLADQ